jgi:DNA-binding NarL/FixJ family response regulator
MPDILIVEDHPIVARGLQKLILDKGIASKCDIAGSIRECMQFLDIYTPDLILLDYSLPDGNGVSLCKTVKQLNDKIKILAISSFRAQSIVRSMIDSGASGYVIKNASESEILEAIHNVLAGKQYLCYSSHEIINNNDNPVVVTSREIEILQLIAEGLTNAEMAEKLFLSVATVETHRKNVILKLNAKNTVSLIFIAIQKGYINNKGDY